MSSAEDGSVNDLAGDLEQLKVVEAPAQQAAAPADKDANNAVSGEDDGYSSSTSSNENLSLDAKVKKEEISENKEASDNEAENKTTEVKEDDRKETVEEVKSEVKAASTEVKSEDEGAASEDSKEASPETDYDDEKVLEPLVIVGSTGKENDVGIEIISRGPVSVEPTTGDHRYQPYGRPAGGNNANNTVGGDSVITHTSYNNNAAGGNKDESGPPAKPNLLIYTKKDADRPVKLEGAHVEWMDLHELRIDKTVLPDDTLFVDSNNIQLMVQLNPNVTDTKSFLAHVKKQSKAEGSGEGATEKESYYIGPIIVSLKTDLTDSQEKLLLKAIPEEEREAAKKLVDQKDISQLTAGIGPHKDTVLSILCANRKSPNPGQIRAQIYAVIQRLIKDQDEAVRHTVFKLNNNGISPFEIAAITNNKPVACYLAEVMYNLVDDTKTALKILNAKDSQGNSIVHLLSRKGDCTAPTLKGLLSMALTDGTRLFSVGVNSKRQAPVHIAAQSVTNQPETLKVLYQVCPRSFGLPDDDGMTPLHYACQRTHDSALVQTILSYKKDNINEGRKDGLTPLDLIMNRPTSETEDEAENQFVIESGVKEEIVRLIRNNGGKSYFDQGQGGGANSTGYPGSNNASVPCSLAYGSNGGINGTGGNLSSNGDRDNSPTSPYSPYCVPNNISPMGSPYSGYSSGHSTTGGVVDSPQTFYDGSNSSPAPNHYNGGNMSNGGIRAPGSVESYIQSSPESVHGEQQFQILGSNGAVTGGTSNNYYNGPYGWNEMMGQGSPYYDGENTGRDIEEHLASQIMNEFPEIRNLMGQILDGNL